MTIQRIKSRRATGGCVYLATQAPFMVTASTPQLAVARLVALLKQAQEQ